MGLFDRFRSSITYPIVTTLILVTVVPVMAVGLILASRNREYLTTLEKQYLTRQAVDLAAEVRMFFAAHRARLEGVTAALSSSAAVEGSAVEAVLREIGEKDSALQLVRLVDGEGQQVLVRRETLESSVLPVLQQHLDEAAATVLREGRAVEETVGSGTAGRPGYWLVAHPVRGKEGVTRVLEAVFGFEPLVERLRDGSLVGLEVTIVDRRGRAVLASKAGVVGRDLSGIGPVADFLKVPIRVTKVYRNPALSTEGPVLGSIAPVDGMGWAVLVERPTTEAFAAVSAMQRSTLVLSVLAALVGLAVGLGVSRSLTRPIRQLAAVSSRIAEGDLAVRAQVPGENEIARLADNFNRMAGSVEALVRRLKQALRQNQELFLETIKTLAAAVDAKDPYTRGHSERVSSYSMAIARHLGLAPEAVFRIRIAAILHDVGKLGVRDEVLKKPGKLTPEEFEEMKRHPAIGAQIMEPIRLLRDILPGIRNHHERWDGQGYPDGLKGEEIPMVARIISVADTFDAMTTNRPYQTALSLDYVLAKMREMAGSRYDERVVEALVEAVRRGDITPPAVVETGVEVS